MVSSISGFTSNTSQRSPRFGLNFRPYVLGLGAASTVGGGISLGIGGDQLHRGLSSASDFIQNSVNPLLKTASQFTNNTVGEGEFAFHIAPDKNQTIGEFLNVTIPGPIPKTEGIPGQNPIITGAAFVVAGLMGLASAATSAVEKRLTKKSAEKVLQQPLQLVDVG